MKRLKIVLGVLLVSATLAGCASNAGNVLTAAGPGQVPAKSVDQRVVQGGTRFGINLFQQLRAAAPGQNVFISPLSAFLALSLTNNGARGETQEAITQALQVQGLTPAEVNQANAGLQSILANPDPQVQITLANSVWYRKGLKLNPAFGDAVQGSYNAVIRDLDFASADAAPTVNRWVKDATNGKIPTLIEQIGPQDALYLINAIYFNGQWTEPFDPQRTETRLFTRPDGTKKGHPFMTKGGLLRYYKGEAFQAVSLPYGGERVSLYVFLPDESSSLDAFCRDLTAGRWEQWMTRFAPSRGRLMLPRVKLEYQVRLDTTLKALGMNAAFQPGKADFGSFFQSSAQPVWISSVVQKTYLDINEKGTEAAAATAVVAAGSAPPKDQPFDMIVDRPYFLAIRDDLTGAVLFMGAIVDPH